MKLSSKNFIIPALFIVFFSFTGCSPEAPPVVNPAEQFLGSYRVNWNSEWTYTAGGDSTIYNSGVDTLIVTMGSADSKVIVEGVEYTLAQNNEGNYAGAHNNYDPPSMLGSGSSVTFFGGDSIFYGKGYTMLGSNSHTTYLGKKLQ